MHLTLSTSVRPALSVLVTCRCSSLSPWFYLLYILAVLASSLLDCCWRTLCGKSSLCTNLWDSLYDFYSVLFCKNRFQCIVSAEVFIQCFGSSCTKLCFTVFAVHFTVNLEYPGDEPTPKRCTFMQCSWGSWVKSPFDHHMKRKKFWFSFFTLTWRLLSLFWIWWALWLSCLKDQTLVIGGH